MYGMADSYAGEMGLEMVLAILGNAFLVLIIMRGNAVSKRKISPVQLLLLHTCVADLLFAFLAMGTGIMELEVLYKYDIDEWVCPVMKFLQAFPLYASPFLLVAISADRFQAICRPLAHYRASRYRMPNLLAAVAWSLAFVCSIPQCYIWEKGTLVTADGNITRCHTVFSHKSQSGASLKVKKFWYIVSFNAVAWLLPSVIASFLYYRVCRAVWSSRVTDPMRDVAQQRNSTCSLKNFQTRCYVDGLRKSTLRRQISEFDRKRMQTVRLTLTIVVCNFLLYAPFSIGNVIKALNEDLISIKLLTYCMILGNLNSCVNPWIYILFNKGHVKRALCISTAVPSKNSSYLYSRCSENAKTDSLKKTNTSLLSKKVVTSGSSERAFSEKRLSMRDEILDSSSPEKLFKKNEVVAAHLTSLLSCQARQIITEMLEYEISLLQSQSSRASSSQVCSEDNQSVV